MRGISRGISSWGSAWTKGMPRSSSAVLLALALLLGCPRSSGGEARSGDEGPARASECPSEPIAVERAPDVRPEHESAEFWLAKLGPEAADAALLDDQAHVFLRERVAALPGGWRDPSSDAVTDPELVDKELRERIEYLRERVASGKYVEIDSGTLERAATRIDAATPITGPNMHFVARETQLWCVPASEGLFTVPVDRDFDRNRCASLHPGELVRALRRTPEWIYVEAGHSVGWMAAEGSPLEPGLSVEAARARLDSPRVYLTADYDNLRHGSSFPLVSRSEQGVVILIPGSEGPVERTLPTDAPISESPWPLTRRKLFEQAFAQLEQPYGWGGRDGHRDCSAYLLDLFALFDVRLPRNSTVQAELGTRSVDLSPLDEHAKRAAIREAARDGVVLLFMPGHILLYLGEDGGQYYGISALSEYLVPCPGGSDTVYRLDKVAVTTLELGRGTERRAFIERISKMALFGPVGE